MQIGIDADRREILCLPTLRRFVHTQIAEAVKRVVCAAGLDSATADILDSGFCTAVVFRIEISVCVEHLCAGEQNALTRTGLHGKFRVTRDLLSEIEHHFALRRMQNRDRLESFMLCNDLALLRDQHLLAAAIRPAEAPVFQRDARIIRFAVVNIAEPDRAFGPLPAFVSRIFPRAVRVGQMQCCQQTRAVRNRLINTGRNPSGEPALSERNGQFIFLAQQRRQIIGLYLQARRIACPAGSQKEISDPLPVQKRFVDAECGDFQLRCCTGARGKMLSENRAYFADILRWIDPACVL